MIAKSRMIKIISLVLVCLFSWNTIATTAPIDFNSASQTIATQTLNPQLQINTNDGDRAPELAFAIKTIFDGVKLKGAAALSSLADWIGRKYAKYGMFKNDFRLALTESSMLSAAGAGAISVRCVESGTTGGISVRLERQEIASAGAIQAGSVNEFDRKVEQISDALKDMFIRGYSVHGRFPQLAPDMAKYAGGGEAYRKTLIRTFWKELHGFIEESGFETVEDFCESLLSEKDHELRWEFINFLMPLMVHESRFVRYPLQYAQFAEAARRIIRETGEYPLLYVFAPGLYQEPITLAMVLDTVGEEEGLGPIPEKRFVVIGRDSFEIPYRLSTDQMFYDPLDVRNFEKSEWIDKYFEKEERGFKPISRIRKLVYPRVVGNLTVFAKEPMRAGHGNADFIFLNNVLEDAHRQDPDAMKGMLNLMHNLLKRDGILFAAGHGAKEYLDRYAKGVFEPQDGLRGTAAFVKCASAGAVEGARPEPERSERFGAGAVTTIPIGPYIAELDISAVEDALRPAMLFQIESFLLSSSFYDKFDLRRVPVSRIVVENVKSTYGRDIVTLGVHTSEGIRRFNVVLYRNRYNLNPDITDPAEQIASRLVYLYRNFDLPAYKDMLIKAGFDYKKVEECIHEETRRYLRGEILSYFDAGGDARVYVNEGKTFVVKELQEKDRDIIKTATEGPLDGYMLAADLLGYIAIRFLILKDLEVRIKEQGKDSAPVGKKFKYSIVQKFVPVFFKEGMTDWDLRDRRYEGILAEAIADKDFDTAKLLIDEFLISIRSMLSRNVFDWDVKSDNYGYDPSFGYIAPLDMGKFQKAHMATREQGRQFILKLQIAKDGIRSWARHFLGDERADELARYFTDQAGKLFGAEGFEFDISRTVNEIEEEEDFVEVVKWNLARGAEGMPVFYAGSPKIRSMAVAAIADYIRKSKLPTDKLQRVFAEVGFSEIGSDYVRSQMLERPYLPGNILYMTSFNEEFVGTKIREITDDIRAQEVLVSGHYGQEALSFDELESIRKGIAKCLIRFYDHVQDVYDRIAEEFSLDREVRVINKLDVETQLAKIEINALDFNKQILLRELLGADYEVPIQAFDRLRQRRRYPFGISLNDFIVVKKQGEYTVGMPMLSSFIRKAREVEVVEKIRDTLGISYETVFEAVIEEKGKQPATIFCEKVFYQARENEEARECAKRFLTRLYSEESRGFITSFLARMGIIGRKKKPEAPKPPPTTRDGVDPHRPPALRADRPGGTLPKSTQDSATSDDSGAAGAVETAGAVGRNEPCPCGSGKKFKKCCLVKGERGRVKTAIFNWLRRNWVLTLLVSAATLLIGKELFFYYHFQYAAPSALLMPGKDLATYYFGPEAWFKHGANPYDNIEWLSLFEKGAFGFSHPNPAARGLAIANANPDNTFGYVASPFNLLLFLPLLVIPFSFLLNAWPLLCVAGFTFIIYKMSRKLTNELPENTQRRTAIGACVLLAMLFWPVTASAFFYGQIEIIYVGLISLAIYYYAFKQDKPGMPIITGGALALATWVKLFPGVFIAYFAFRGLVSFVKKGRTALKELHTKVAIWSVGISAALGVLCLAACGGQIFTAWFEKLRTFQAVCLGPIVSPSFYEYYKLQTLGQGHMFLETIVAVTGLSAAAFMAMRTKLGKFQKETKKFLFSISFIITLLPTIMWQWWHKYNALLIIPMLVSYAGLMNHKPSAGTPNRYYKIAGLCALGTAYLLLNYYPYDLLATFSGNADIVNGFVSPLGYLVKEYQAGVAAESALFRVSEMARYLGYPGTIFLFLSLIAAYRLSIKTRDSSRSEPRSVPAANVGLSPDKSAGPAKITKDEGRRMKGDSAGAVETARPEPERSERFGAGAVKGERSPRVAKRREEILKILDSAERPLFGSEVGKLVRSVKGFEDIKEGTVRRDIREDRRLAGHAMLRDSKARRERVLEILDASKAPVSSAEIAKRLRRTKRFKYAEESVVRDDMKFDSRIADHPNLKKESDPENIKARRKAMLDILDSLENPIITSELTRRMREVQGFESIEEGIVKSDINLDSRIGGHPMLKTKDFDVVRIRRKAEKKILDASKKPMDRRELTIELRKEPGFEDVEETLVKGDIGSDDGLGHHPNLKRRKITHIPRKDVIQARRDAIFRVLEVAEKPINQREITRRVRETSGYESMEENTVRNDVKLDKRLAGHRNLKKEVDNGLVQARRNAVLTILSSADEPIDSAQITRLLRKTPGFENTEEGLVKGDIDQDDNIANHPMLKKQDNNNTVKSRRDEILKALDFSEKPIDKLEITRRLRQVPGFKDVDRGTVSHDISSDSRLMGHPMLVKNDTAGAVDHKSRDGVDPHRPPVLRADRPGGTLSKSTSRGDFLRSQDSVPTEDSETAGAVAFKNPLSKQISETTKTITALHESFTAEMGAKKVCHLIAGNTILTEQMSDVLKLQKENWKSWSPEKIKVLNRLGEGKDALDKILAEIANLENQGFAVTVTVHDQALLNGLPEGIKAIAFKGRMEFNIILVTARALAREDADTLLSLYRILMRKDFDDDKPVMGDTQSFVRFAQALAWSLPACSSLPIEDLETLREILLAFAMSA